MEVTLSRLTKRFDREAVLSDVDLVFGPGQIVAIIGLNGAGKTTLLRCLAQVIVPTSGSIRWNDTDSLRDNLELHRQMMFLPDSPLLIGEHTVIEHVVLCLRAYGCEGTTTEQAVVDMLRQLDLVEHCEKRLRALSRGQRFKVAMSALLLIDPELWLLDEPFASGMDPQGMLALKQHARAAAAAGSCVIYTTQILEIAERFCDLLIVLDHGRVSQRIGRDELRAMPEEGPGSLGERLTSYRNHA
jgi:ABC-type multidrug transport system ATPase subunit